MRLTTWFLFSCLIVSSVEDASADLIFYTDRATFESATSGLVLRDSIDFDGVANGTSANGATYGSNITSFSTSTAAVVEIMGAPADPYLRSQVSPRPLRLDFSDDVFAVGMDVINLNSGLSVNFNVWDPSISVIGGQTLGPNPSFVGVLSTEVIGRVQVSESGGFDSNAGFDNIDVMSTPEPSSIVLLATGAIGLIPFRKRKRNVAA